MAQFLVEREMLLSRMCLDAPATGAASGSGVNKWWKTIRISMSLNPRSVLKLRRRRRLPFGKTRRLYRLRAERVVAVVAADMEDEARALAARHDLHGRDGQPRVCVG
jgi:hypothetical protein